MFTEFILPATFILVSAKETNVELTMMADLLLGESEER